jgi:DNA-binding PadR family transcriptional regulator
MWCCWIFPGNNQVRRKSLARPLSTLPTLILQALLEEPSHGYRIAQSIKARSKGVLDFKEGTLYPALHKLENEGMVESYEGMEGARGATIASPNRDT